LRRDLLDRVKKNPLDHLVGLSSKLNQGGIMKSLLVIAVLATPLRSGVIVGDNYASASVVDSLQ
jgi:hypothetical protein